MTKKVDPGPFLEWFDRRVAYHTEVLEREARLAGVAKVQGAHKLVIEQELGWTHDAGNRRILRWRNEVHVAPLAQIEDALDAAGVQLAELYPDEVREDAMLERFCGRCDESVTTDSTLVCPWCETRTVNIIVCPACGGPKSGPARFCANCAPRGDVRGRHEREDNGEVCPSCDGPKSKWALRCWTCYVAAGSHRGRRHRKSTRNLACIDQPTLEEARRLYDSGLSIRAVAREIHPQTTYSSQRSCANALFDLFRARGWPLRERAAATIQSNIERAFRPQCSFVTARGVRCEKRCVGDDETCYRHSPERMAAGIARLRARDGRVAA